ncbi:MAG: DnaA N-terminal domain-containing protein [Pseudomonadota bacterium]
MNQTNHAIGGRYSAAIKYDILTAVGALALSQGKHDQRRSLRFLTLVTARYNWPRNRLAVGQREIAALWHCDERTVKREMAQLRAMGWLVLKRQGRRGHVAEYGLDIDKIQSTTRPVWAAIGPDFTLRQEGLPDGNVVPLTPRADIPAPDLTSADEWGLTAALIHREDPASYAAWIRPLRRVGRSGGRLTLAAPSRFHAAYVETHLKSRLIAAAQTVDADIDDIALTF